MNMSVSQSHTSWISEKSNISTIMEWDSTKNMKLNHFKDNSERSTQADRQMASDVLIPSYLFVTAICIRIIRYDNFTWTFIFISATSNNTSPKTRCHVAELDLWVQILQVPDWGRLLTADVLLGPFQPHDSIHLRLSKTTNQIPQTRWNSSNALQHCFFFFL